MPLFAAASALTVIFFAAGISPAAEQGVSLKALIAEALQKSPELQASRYRSEALSHKIPQAAALPDPMFMVGYQNEGWKKYTYGEMQGAQWMFNASQMFPFPGKLALKEEMALRDHEGSLAAYMTAKARTAARVRELYYDLFIAYRSLDLIDSRTALYAKVEEAAAARYVSGMGSQSDILMAQTEKYMLSERGQMLRQKIESTEAMLKAVIGRDDPSPLGRPQENVSVVRPSDAAALLQHAYQNSPELRAKEAMVAAAEARLRMAAKEYYPDVTLNAGLAKRRGEFEDMWSLTTTVNIPLFYRNKQREGVLEAEALLSEARQELQAQRLMISSAIQDNLSMLRTAERLMELYREGLIPKTYQDFDAALAIYTSGKSDIMSAVSRLKAAVDAETAYWNQYAEKEKALARIAVMTAVDDLQAADNMQDPKKEESTPK